MLVTMTAQGALGLALATFVFAVIPGPGVAAVVGQALTRGLRSALLWSVGIVLGDLCYLLLALLGLSFIARELGPAFQFLKWLGAAYLMYLGLRSLRRGLWPVGGEEAETAAPPPRSLARTFLGGLGVSLGNPKVVAFYCGFLPGFVDLQALSGLDMALVVAVILPVALGVASGYAWLAARGRMLLKPGRARRAADLGAGAAMLGAGALVAAQ